MATNNQLKFYRLGAEAMASKTVSTGAIWFNTDDKTIQIKTAAGWDKYAGKLNDAQWDTNKQKLTISKYDGSSIELDFSDIASGTSVKAALDALETKLQKNIDGANTAASNAQDAADAAQVDVDAVEKKLGDGFSEDSTVTAQLAAVKATADAAAVKTTVDAALELKADKAQVSTDIAAAKSDAEATAAADATAKANAAQAAAIARAEELDDATNGRIDTIETDYKEADEAILEQIEGIVAASVSVKNADGDKYVVVTKATNKNEYTIASKGIDAAIKVETDRATAAEEGLQGDINVEKGRINVLVGNVEGDDSKSVRSIAAEETAKIVAGAPEAYDTLQEIAAWIASHPDSVATLNAAIEKNTQAITAETEARDAADKVHTQGIADLVAADAAQDTLIAAKADQTDLDDTNDRVSALEGLVGTTSVGVQIDAKIDALKLDETYVNESDYSNDQVAVSNRIKAVEDAVDTLEGKMSTAESDIDHLETAVANLQTGTGLGESNKPDYTNSNYLGSATTMVAADKVLDAKIKEVADSVTSKNVEAQGDAYVSATASNNKVTIATVTGTVESKSGLATNQGVYDALCWVEFA